MSRGRLHIDRLEIRLRGVSPDAARDSAERLGHTLLEELALQELAGRAGAPQTGARAPGGEAVASRGGEADAASVQGGVAGRESDLSGAIARKVAASIRERLK